MDNKISKQEQVVVLKVMTMIVIISGLANCIYLLLIPSDSKNNVFLNYSISRLLLVGFLFFGLLLFFILLLKLFKDPQIILKQVVRYFQKKFWINLILIFFFAIVSIAWFAFLSPPYILGKLSSIVERLRPIIIWLLTVSVLSLLLAAIIKNDWILTRKINYKKQLKVLILTVCIVLGFSLSIALIYPRLTDDYSWYGRYSVPILATQIFFSWVLITLLKQFSDEINSIIPSFFLKNIDWIIFFAIWICAAILWVNQPIEFMGEMYFTTIEQHLRPFPTAYEIFPWKDSRTYFQITESVIIGNGIYRSIDKPLFLAFESLNNWLAGGSYEKMLNLQVWVLALFPSIIYLLGKELHSRSAGIMGAALAVLQEINGIGIMDEFPVVSSKVLLSEPFMQLWTGLIVLTAVLAFKKYSKNQGNLFLICGGTLGLSVLFRLNTLIIIPFVLLIMLIYFIHDKKALFKFTLFFLIGIFLALTPWMIYNTVKFNNPFAFIKAKGFVIERRIEKATSQKNSQNNDFSYSPTLINVSSNFNTPELSNPNLEEIEQLKLQAVEAINFVPSNLGGNKEIGSDKKLDGVQIESFKSFGLFENSKIIQLSLSVLQHFINNIITSFSIIPTSIIPQDLYHGSRAQRFWGGYDANLYIGINPFILILNIIIVSIGISRAVEKNKIIGLIPIAVYFGYHMSNGLATASGNRYAQPASWMIFFYYAIGLIVMSQCFLRQLNYKLLKKKLTPTFPKFEITRNQKKGKLWFLTAAILLIGSMPVGADLIPINRFPEINNELIVLKIIEDAGCQGELRNAGFTDDQEFMNFVNAKGYIASIGRMLGPFRLSNEEYKIIFPKAWDKLKRDDNLFTFSFFEPKSKKPKQMIFYPRDQNIELNNGSDAIIISDLDAEAIVIGIIDSNYALNSISYDDLSNISFSCHIADIAN